VVGSRAATTYALDVAARLSGELAERGIVVVSGLARGVDSAAHRGCLDAGGPTVAVLGSGVDRVYPPEHDLLAETVASSGVVVSELGPGGLPVFANSGLSDTCHAKLSFESDLVDVQNVNLGVGSQGEHGLERSAGVVVEVDRHEDPTIQVRGVLPDHQHGAFALR